MVTTIDIDIGGTFTEALVNKDEKIAWGKVLTTPHDLSLGVVRAISEAAKQLKMESKDLLSQTEIIRYSTTLALNNLIQRKGTKLGLITSAGLEHLLFIGRSRQWGDGLPPYLLRKTGSAVNPEPLIREDLVVGLKERVDALGNVIFKPSREEIREAVRLLVNKGARGIVVQFLWSFLNPSNEQYVKQIIEEEMPEVYLMNMPIFLSSEVQPKWLEYPRMMVTILNAYLHRTMSEQLSTLRDEIKELGYNRPLMLVHNTGGMAKLSRSRVTDTYSAGPVAGMGGSLCIGKMYGIKNIITAEMGGTTFNMGVIADGNLKSYEFDPVIDRWAVNVTLIENRSIGAGGGSIAWLNSALGNRLEVGPFSAGSNPGPSCYGLGGREPTVTDADLVLGYLNERFFLGGRIRLDKQRARNAIKSKIADPLNLSIEEAAWGIKKVIDEHMGSEIFADVALKGHDPREFAMFSFGGAGPVHASGINTQLGTKQIFTFPFGAVYDALGASFLNIKHIYEKSVGITAFDPNVPLASHFEFYAEKFNSAVNEMQKAAIRDIKSEGLKQDQISFALELEMRYETQLMVTTVLTPTWSLKKEEDASKIITKFKSEYFKYCGIEFPSAVIRIENLRLLAEAPAPLVPTFTKYELGPENANNAIKDKRPAYWPSTGFKETPIYDLNKLGPGNRIQGQAIVEAPETTFVLPENMNLKMDEYRNVVLTSN